MKLYDQEFLTDVEAGIKGDCMAACLKTILQDDLAGFPHPLCETGGWNFGFWDALEAKHKLQVHYQPNTADKDMSFMGDLVIAAGPTVRTAETKATHAVVWSLAKNQIVHDPHPSRSGLIAVDGYYFIGKFE